METLTKVYQTDLNVDSGNCFCACLASLTGLSIEAIPLFRGDRWLKDCAHWLFERGFQLTGYSRHRIDKGYYIVGRDPFLIRGVGWRRHAIIYKEEQEAHNPVANRTPDEIIAANSADGITEDDILERRSGILYTMVVRPINAQYRKEVEVQTS